MDDELHKFIFEGQPVRDMRVCLGEIVATGVLMRANIKFDGALVLQIFGAGPVKRVVADVQPDLGFRATATVVGEVAPDARLRRCLSTACCSPSNSTRG